MELIIEHSQNHHHQKFSWVLTLCEKSKYEGVLELLKISKIGCNFRAQSDRVETIHRQVYYRMGTLKNLRRDVTFFWNTTFKDYGQEIPMIKKPVRFSTTLRISKPSNYRIYSNTRHGAYLIFRVSGAALIRGRRLFEGGAYLKGSYQKNKIFDRTI